MELQKEDIRSIKILHTALTVGVTLILCILYWLVNSKGIWLNNTGTMFIVGCVVVMIGVFASERIYKSRVEKDAETSFPNYTEAVASFRANNIIRWALLEGPALVATLLMFTDKNQYLFVPAVAALACLLYARLKERDFKEHYSVVSDN